jgi:PAS domain S-box-containing protein
MQEVLERDADALVRASSQLFKDLDSKRIITQLVEQAHDISKSDLSCLYLYDDPEKRISSLSQSYKRGRFETPGSLPARSELVDFIVDCGEPVVILERKKSPFIEILLNSKMESGIALPLSMPKSKIGIFILNSAQKNYYGNKLFRFLSSFVRMAGSTLNNADMYKELQNQYRQVEALQRYQESVFSSMTNLLITTDSKGNIHYFNDAARERLGITEEDFDKDFTEVFQKRLSKKIMSAIRKSSGSDEILLGLEGIFKGEKKDIDFSLNVSPLLTKRGKSEGLTLLFTDQTREKELKEQMTVATEERRIIKDMFSRYMSMEVVQNLMEKPDLVRPGGDKKTATIFFADIRGYTSFSEGQEPEYIIEVLNEYFSEAVEIVIKNKGYIDKFIGDCIMAAWGVPTFTEEEDAYRAVASAVEIQELVRSKDRSFFKGKASKLKIGIGMHTGPLIAGNLGSSRRMDYSVIGDTVNIAARLEGVAEANEVIITENTRDLLGDKFKLEEREPVSVKGKKKPLHIFNVVKILQ